MVARIRTMAFEGIDVRPVDAQLQISGDMPAFTLVLPIVVLSAMGEFVPEASN